MIIPAITQPTILYRLLIVERAMGLFSYKYELQMVAAEKQTPAINPTLHPVIHPPLPMRVMNKESPMVVISIVIKEAIMIPARPVFARESLMFTPEAFIHAFLNRAEYHIAPKKK